MNGCWLSMFGLMFLTICHMGATSHPAEAQDKSGTPAQIAAPGSSPKDPQQFVMKNIPPLYVKPALPGEGIWVKEDMSGGRDPVDLVYRTVYRPSDRFPTAVVYMMALNMKHLSARLFLGSAEPYGKGYAPKLEDTVKPQLTVVTNALWQTAHAGKGGIILGGRVLKKMDPGVAAIVVYKNQNVDILEWNDEIPVSEVQDARQLKHLIAKDGKVVTSLEKGGKTVSAEIGIGSLLNEDRPTTKVPATAPGEKETVQLNFTSGDLWFLATRSAFGIRPDGNLVFAVGHHISTVDLAKALVLAGCDRALHGDANPGNCAGVLFVREETGAIKKTLGLSPLQDVSVLDRYLKGSYPKDFFAFFRR